MSRGIMEASFDNIVEMIEFTSIISLRSNVIIIIIIIIIDI